MNPNDPIFPDKTDIAGFHQEWAGLSKRELFAAMAMMGFCSNTGLNNVAYQQISKFAVIHADTLIKELSGKKK